LSIYQYNLQAIAHSEVGGSIMMHYVN